MALLLGFLFANLSTPCSCFFFCLFVCFFFFFLVVGVVVSSRWFLSLGLLPTTHSHREANLDWEGPPRVASRCPPGAVS